MVHSATYTVSTQGSDNNPGTAQSPWRTIQKAANTAIAGDTVEVQAGTYVERVTFPNSGTVSKPIIFTGVRSSSGGWDTIIDGSSATSGWVTASEVGSGVWKTTLGYTPQALTSQGKTIWKISDRAMNGEVLFGTNGNGFSYLARSATAKTNTAFGQVTYWDGIEALFGNRSGTTYLRFRNGDNPATRNVRAAPAGAVLTINGRHHLTLRNFKIVGGQYAVHVTGQGQNNTLENSYLANGQRRVFVHGAVNTMIRNNTLTMEGLGTENFPPGDRDPSTYGRIVNRHQYDQNKFIVGETDTNDASIMLANSNQGASSNTTIIDNEISHGMLGIQISGTTTNTLITNNKIHNFSDTGIYIYPDSASIQASYNLFYDSDHHFRINNLHRNLDVYIFANRFHQPWYNTGGGGGKHVHFSPDTSRTTDARIWVYHNSFAGGGWACDVGVEGATPTLPNVHILNNFISTNGLTSGSNPNGWEVTSNYIDKLWYSNAIPDFVLPADHKARNNGVDLISRGLPGITATYYQNDRPDIGAIQGPSQTIIPPPTKLRATTK
jgi:hypothetical protein